MQVFTCSQFNDEGCGITMTKLLSQFVYVYLLTIIDILIWKINVIKLTVKCVCVCVCVSECVCVCVCVCVLCMCVC